MSDQEYTAQQAADPNTPGQVLADIAAVRPDLRPAVAANPSAYPSLLEWLRGLGEPSVDAALRARPSVPAVEAQSAVPPQQGPYAAPGGTAAGGQPGYGGQFGQSAQPGAGPQPAYGMQPPYGAQPGYTQPAYGSQPGSPYGARPGGVSAYGAPGTTPGYAGYQPAPQKSGNRKALLIVLGIAGFLLLLGIVGFFVVRGLIANAIPDQPDGYGDEPSLDALYDRCAAEDWAACDQLFDESPIGSEYERFGETCGNRTDGELFCTEEMGEAAGLGGTEQGAAAEGEEATAAPFGYGDDAVLDALYDRCGSGDDAACDELYSTSPLGSEYEAYGDTCGERGRPEGQVWCVP